MSEPEYNGKPVSSYDVWALTIILKSMEEALVKREEAKKNPKFIKMVLPPPNPEFVKLKTAIEEEIRKRK